MKSDTFAMSDDLSVRFSNWLLDEHKGDSNAYRMDMDVMAVNQEYREHKINEFLLKNNNSLLKDIDGIAGIKTPESKITPLNSKSYSPTEVYRNAIDEVEKQKFAAHIDREYEAIEITNSAKETFKDDFEKVKENLNTSGLNLEKEKFEKEVQEKIDIPFVKEHKKEK